jgi:hypothetical protein
VSMYRKLFITLYFTDTFEVHIGVKRDVIKNVVLCYSKLCPYLVEAPYVGFTLSTPVPTKCYFTLSCMKTISLLI